MATSSIRRGFDRAAILTFALAILAPALDLVLRPAVARSVSRENRYPWPFPERVTGFTTLSKFPVAFENWFEDRLGMRDVLLGGHQLVRLYVFGVEPSPTMLVGPEGWLYFGSDDSPNVHRGLAPLDETGLEAVRASIEERDAWLRSRGVATIFAIAPDKESIYPEHAPSALRPLGPSRLDQVTAWMATRSAARFLDLRPALRAESSRDAGDDFTYHPLGSHWTSRGAWAAWNAILAELRPAFPALAPLAREEYVTRERPASESDSFGRGLYVGERLSQGSFRFEPRAGARAECVLAADGHVVRSRRIGAELPRAVVAHDSFGYWILPHMAESFAELDAYWVLGFPKHEIEERRPDLVVQVYTERRLRLGIPRLERDLVRIDAAEFEALDRLLGPLDLLEGPLPATEGRVGLARRDGALEVELGLVPGLLRLPFADVPAGAKLAFHVDVTAPAAADLHVFHGSRAEPKLSRAGRKQIHLEAGRNDLYFKLEEADAHGALALLVGSEPGTYRVHAIEARTVSAAR